ncbi:hypothetical protein [Nocardioides perillae]|uniref:Uncharacterized protein n=1 Tax=Nocardioides perillae TaxID=1119534 RepID=A0A7Y9RSR3_9ACTN|nr:hypothetical protein [Nocardioides perillae]NYG55660.1 hypothetical protein [Nocardioides perillae]
MLVPRFAAAFPFAGAPPLAGLRLAEPRLDPLARVVVERVVVLRDRVLEVPAVLPPRGVLELRDPGGEDVRVAMLRP